MKAASGGSGVVGTRPPVPGPDGARSGVGHQCGPPRQLGGGELVDARADIGRRRCRPPRRARRAGVGGRSGLGVDGHHRTDPGGVLSRVEGDRLGGVLHDVHAGGLHAEFDLHPLQGTGERQRAGVALARGRLAIAVASTLSTEGETSGRRDLRQRHRLDPAHQIDAGVRGAGQSRTGSVRPARCTGWPPASRRPSVARQAASHRAPPAATTARTCPAAVVCLADIVPRCRSRSASPCHGCRPGCSPA